MPQLGPSEAEKTEPQNEGPSIPKPEADTRPEFRPREAREGEVTSVTIPLVDGKIDFEKMRDKTLERLKGVVTNPEARRKLGLVRDESEPRITVEALKPVFAAVGIAEGLAVAWTAKIPAQMAIPIMMFNDEEFSETAPVAADILEKSAPQWLRTLILSDNAKLGQLAMLLFKIHQRKLAQIKALKMEMATQPQPQPQAVQ